jgi:hypothetical protein
MIVSAYSSRRQSARVGDVTAMKRIGWSAGLTFR